MNLCSATVEAPQFVEMFPAYHILNGLLSSLLVLHAIWTYFIMKAVYTGIFAGKVSVVKAQTTCTTRSVESTS